MKIINNKTYNCIHINNGWMGKLTAMTETQFCTEMFLGYSEMLMSSSYQGEGLPEQYILLLVHGLALVHVSLRQTWHASECILQSTELWWSRALSKPRMVKQTNKLYCLHLSHRLHSVSRA